MPLYLSTVNQTTSHYSCICKHVPVKWQIRRRIAYFCNLCQISIVIPTKTFHRLNIVSIATMSIFQNLLEQIKNYLYNNSKNPKADNHAHSPSYCCSFASGNEDNIMDKGITAAADNENNFLCRLMGDRDLNKARLCGVAMMFITIKHTRSSLFCVISTLI